MYAITHFMRFWFYKYKWNGEMNWRCMNLFEWCWSATLRAKMEASSETSSSSRFSLLPIWTYFVIITFFMALRYRLLFLMNLFIVMTILEWFFHDFHEIILCDKLAYILPFMTKTDIGLKRIGKHAPFDYLSREFHLNWTGARSTSKILNVFEFILIAASKVAFMNWWRINWLLPIEEKSRERR